MNESNIILWPTTCSLLQHPKTTIDWISHTNCERWFGCRYNYNELEGPGSITDTEIW